MFDCGFALREMNNEVPYWNPPKLYPLSLKAVEGVLKKRFDESGSDGLTKAELAFPASVCNHLVARFMSNFFTSKDLYSKSLLSAVVGSPWCRLTKLHLIYIKYSRDGLEDSLDHRTLKLFQHPLTELTIECNASSTCKYVNFVEIGTSLGDTLTSLTLKHCNIKYEDVSNGFNHLVKLVRLNMHEVTFSGVHHGENNKLLVLPHLEVVNLSVADAFAIFSAQRNVKVLQLYNVSLETDMFNLLTNLVVLDISRNAYDEPVNNLSAVKVSALMVFLSKLPSLRSLDISCRELSDTDLQIFDQPHHRMAFLGLFNTGLCHHQNINADLVCLLLWCA